MTVDKELLFEFLLLEHDEISDVHLKEVKKVIDIVLNKYFPANFDEFGELQAEVMVKLFENKVNYNPRFDAYNYIFTIARNQAGNLLRKLHRELLTDEFWSEGKEDSHSDEVEDNEQDHEFESAVVQKYYKKLTGMEEWNYLRVRQTEVAEILLFFHKYKFKEIPSYLKYDHKVAERLYYILNTLLLKDENGQECTD